MLFGVVCSCSVLFVVVCFFGAVIVRCLLLCLGCCSAWPMAVCRCLLLLVAVCRCCSLLSCVFVRC